MICSLSSQLGGEEQISLVGKKEQILEIKFLERKHKSQRKITENELFEQNTDIWKFVRRMRLVCEKTLIWLFWEYKKSFINSMINHKYSRWKLFSTPLYSDYFQIFLWCLHVIYCADVKRTLYFSLSISYIYNSS